MLDLDTYQNANESLPIRCIYHLGVRSGFFSEYNNMIWGMLYCLRLGIRFELTTVGANFAFDKGWCDYFLPFCPEHRNPLHHPWLHPRFPGHTLKDRLRQDLLGDLIRQLEHVDALTYDIWQGLRLQNAHDLVTLPSLNLTATVYDLSRALTALTWRLNPQALQAVTHHVNTLNLPPRYAGLHIRAGDKAKETPPRAVETYMEKLQATTGLRDIFVMSDDFRHIARLRAHWPSHTFHTLTPETACGYHHRTFARQSPARLREDHLLLFASIQAMLAAQTITCSYTTNIGVFLGMAAPPGTCHAIDRDTWTMW